MERIGGPASVFGQHASFFKIHGFGYVGATECKWGDPRGILFLASLKLSGLNELFQVLLSEGQVLAALKLAKDDVNPRKYLTAAKNSGDPTLLHSVLYYFRNHPKFASTLQNGTFFADNITNNKYASLFSDERLHGFINEYNEIFSSIQWWNVIIFFVILCCECFYFFSLLE